MPLLAAWLLTVAVASAQSPPPASGSLRPDWRRIGDSSYDAGLASPATGPVNRVWFAEDGLRLFLRTADGRGFESVDFEAWRPAPGLQAPEAVAYPAGLAPALPEPDSKVRAADRAGRLYAYGRHVYRSDDGGERWVNLTRYRGASIIGEGILDLAVSPLDADFIVAANSYGIWRSADGGLSWSGVNGNLPNLPVRRLLETPAGSRGTRILLATGDAVEWAPGERQSWRLVLDAAAVGRAAARRGASIQLGAAITAVAMGRDYSYAGASDGRLWVSRDQGASWSLTRLGGGAPVESLYIPPERPAMAFAALGKPPADGGNQARVLRSLDGGIVWDDLTGDLPAGAALGIACDPSGTAVYVGSDAGAFFSALEAGLNGTATHWISMSGSLPPVASVDVGLDQAGNQVYVALAGYGVYAAPAPHRFWNLQVVSAADFSPRPAAPGSLLTVLGGRLIRARAGLLDVPVLAASETQAQIQIPFEAAGRSTVLALELTGGQFNMPLPLQDASPAIFIDYDGSPMALDADTGALLDGQTPARASSLIQVLATGLGKVQPAWPAGKKAPIEAPPRVIAPVRAFLNRTPLEVTRAVLAPGYVGFYLVELRLPPLVDEGPAELYLEVDGHESNKTRIYLEQ